MKCMLVVSKYVISIFDMGSIVGGVLELFCIKKKKPGDIR